MRDLLALTGAEPPAGLSAPLDPATAAQPPEGTEPAGAAVSLDPPEAALAALAPAAEAVGGEDHPALRRLEETAQSWERAARSARAGLWPKVQFKARASRDYPNGPVLEDFHQNLVGVWASFPLFEAGRTRREAEEGELMAGASRGRLDQARRDRGRDRLKAGDRLLGLQVQRELDRVSVRETQDLSARIYDSYIAGRSTFIEVQGANLRELEARVGAARTDAQTLMQLAVLAELSGKE
jgi:outer membrane protein TolC